MTELSMKGMTLAPGVVETIISIATQEVEGVAFVGSAAESAIRQMFTAKPSTQGIGVDMEMVAQAIAMDGRSRAELSAAMKELTELENPNSVQQMKQWLAENGMETDSLDKKAVAELLKTAPEPLGEALSLRQQLAKSSVKKYQAMENAVCADSRAHGMFQFYGSQ